MTKTYTILYSFNGRKLWAERQASTLLDARRSFMSDHCSDNVQILDVSVEPVLTICR